MSCHVARRRDDGLAPLTGEQIATFLDLARQGHEDTFKELARCLGVGADTLDEFWTWTVTRARPSLRRDSRAPSGGE